MLSAHTVFVMSGFVYLCCLPTLCSYCLALCTYAVSPHCVRTVWLCVPILFVHTVSMVCVARCVHTVTVYRRCLYVSTMYVAVYPYGVGVSMYVVVCDYTVCVHNVCGCIPTRCRCVNVCGCVWPHDVCPQCMWLCVTTRCVSTMYVAVCDHTVCVHNVSGCVWPQCMWLCVTTRCVSTMYVAVCDHNVCGCVWPHGVCPQCMWLCVTTMYVAVCDHTVYVCNVRGWYPHAVSVSRLSVAVYRLVLTLSTCTNVRSSGQEVKMSLAWELMQICKL